MMSNQKTWKEVLTDKTVEELEGVLRGCLIELQIAEEMKDDPEFGDATYDDEGNLLPAIEELREDAKLIQAELERRKNN